jgi:uncharacterized phage protein (TIGR02216 family)
VAGFDWRGLMRAGMHDLRLTPDQFWRLTPAELLVMLGIEGGAAPLTRARLAELSAAFPDGVTRGPWRGMPRASAFVKGAGNE